MPSPLDRLRRRKDADAPAGEPSGAPTGADEPAPADEPTRVSGPGEPPPGEPATAIQRTPAPGAPRPAGARPTGEVPGATAAEPEPVDLVPNRPGVRERGPLRRRLRYLRRVRELGYRDLGGLVFEQRRAGVTNDALVEAKARALARLDRELRAIEVALRDERPVHELREAGVSLCARCGALMSSDANYCGVCGTPVGAPAAVAPSAVGAPGGPVAAHAYANPPTGVVAPGSTADGRPRAAATPASGVGAATPAPGVGADPPATGGAPAAPRTGGTPPPPATGGTPAAPTTGTSGPRTPTPPGGVRPDAPRPTEDREDDPAGDGYGKRPG